MLTRLIADDSLAALRFISVDCTGNNGTGHHNSDGRTDDSLTAAVNAHFLLFTH